jgi:hypothetical protein
MATSNNEIQLLPILRNYHSIEDKIDNDDDKRTGDHNNNTRPIFKSQYPSP